MIYAIISLTIDHRRTNDEYDRREIQKQWHKKEDTQEFSGV